MIKVVLLGGGNVAWHLFTALKEAGEVDLVQHFNRTRPSWHPTDPTIPFTDQTSDLIEADVYILAITDDAVSAFSKKLKGLTGLVVHTSGSVPMDALSNGKRYGVLYPVQTFTTGRPLPFRSVPLALESARAEDSVLLEELARALSDHVYFIDSAQRFQLHLSAVFANNFPNFLFLLAREICQESGLSFDMIKPLILETTDKLKTLDPEDAQTGPARRHNQAVIEKHLASLQGEKKQLYEILSLAISKRYPAKQK